MLKFKVGDKVRIKKGLKFGRDEEGNFLNKDMILFGGKIVTIQKIHLANGYDYQLKEVGFDWSEGWLEPSIIRKLKFKDLLR